MLPSLLVRRDPLTYALPTMIVPEGQPVTPRDADPSRASYLRPPAVVNDENPESSRGPARSDRGARPRACPTRPGPQARSALRGAPREGHLTTCRLGADPVGSSTLVSPRGSKRADEHGGADSLLVADQVEQDVDAVAQEHIDGARRAEHGGVAPRQARRWRGRRGRPRAGTPRPRSDGRRRHR